MQGSHIPISKNNLQNHYYSFLFTFVPNRISGVFTSPFPPYGGNLNIWCNATSVTHTLFWESIVKWWGMKNRPDPHSFCIPPLLSNVNMVLLWIGIFWSPWYLFCLQWRQGKKVVMWTNKISRFLYFTVDINFYNISIPVKCKTIPGSITSMENYNIAVHIKRHAWQLTKLWGCFSFWPILDCLQASIFHITFIS